MAIIVIPMDVKPRHFVGGHWKAHQLKKGLHRSSEKSGKRGRKYKAIPPIDGWKGGHPEHNGWKG